MRFLFSLTVLLGLSIAQENGLYAPAPPADAAFVRILHAAPDADAIRATVGAVSYDELGFGAASSYKVVLQGAQTLTAGEVTSDLEVAAGKFYTLAITASGVMMLEDAVSTNRAKALVIMYNLTDIPSVDLKTADSTTEVLMGVAPGTQKSIEVNGITVDLVALSGDVELGAFPGTTLEREAAYSVFVLGTADAPQVVWVQSETVTE
ncbi:MAG: alginate O-acetyltransferase AlgF [Trueperaceae bacterium]